MPVLVMEFSFELLYSVEGGACWDSWTAGLSASETLRKIDELWHQVILSESISLLICSIMKKIDLPSKPSLRKKAYLSVPPFAYAASGS